MYDKMLTQKVEAEIQDLFGETSYQLERRLCTGKYLGHTDYTLVFGSGRRLYIGLDERNYPNSLRDKLRDIRHFRAHQSENAMRINAVLRQYETPFCHADVEIVPYDGMNSLTLYAVVVLSTSCGVKFVYRATNMYGYLVGYDAPYFAFESCMEDLLNDACGKMKFFSPYPVKSASAA